MASSGGSYLTYIIATLHNDSSVVLNSSDDLNITTIVSDTVAPAKGAGLNGTLAIGSGTTNNQINLRWSNISTDAAGNPESNVRYVLYYIQSNTAVNTSPTDGNLNTSGYSLLYNGTTNSTSYSCESCTSDTIYHFFVTTLDDAGNVNLSVTTGTGGNYFNTTLKYTAETITTTTGGGGGGGGGTAATTTEGISASKMWSVIAVGENTMKISKEAISVTELVINMKNQVSNAQVTVTKLDEKPSTISPAPIGEIYQYIKIEKSAITDEDIENTKIKFRVTKSWLTTKGINEGDVVLKKFTTKWIKLSTKKISSDSSYATYEATTSGFSYFAITGKKAEIKVAEVIDEEVEAEEEVTGAAAAEKIAEEKGPTKRKLWSWVIVSSVIVIGLVIYFILISKRKKEES